MDTQLHRHVAYVDLSWTWKAILLGLATDVLRFFFRIKEPEGNDARARTTMPKNAESTDAAPKPLRVVKPRAPARPHRKLPEDVLKVRVAETKKRLQVLQSRAVLMADRLATYEKEVEYRVQ